MAALLVGLSVMGVLLTVAMPVWKQSTRREKEAELIFRGMQYSRAVSLFQRKHGPGTLPPSVDVLVEEHDLRKKYKDPITDSDFKVLLQGQGAPAGPAGRGASTPTQGAPGRGAPASPSSSPFTPVQLGQRGVAPSAGPPGVGGVIGVQSKSTDESIRIYNGRTHYNEWAFIFQPPVQAPGTGAPGAGGPGRQGGPGGLGQRGGAGTFPPFGSGGRGRGASPPPQQPRTPSTSPSPRPGGQPPPPPRRPGG